MTPERWAEIDRIHAVALDRPMAERAAYLDEACAGDPLLRREVESLLAYASAAETFLDQPAVQEAAAEFGANEPMASDVLPIVPGYSVLQVLGAGGMGIVYLAEQDPPLRRRVALKLIRPGLDSKSALARFEAERRALALMDHPNIAAVFGTGVAADGRPFVAMELVAGVPITEYCDRLRLSVRARLDLFGKVCAGVQHAHQKGVIHRDIKPSNVLVAEQDDRPVPKVIDFGTATLADRPMALGLGLTDAGTVVGTLEYMSPEQAALSADIDTATDVYSLGVLLYELLVGRLPFDRRQLQAAGYDQMRRVIQESDPPRPSVHLAGAELAANEISDTRASNVGRLARELTGDLDWIVLRALEKDRRRRYSTVSAFAADIERFLTNQAIEARPPSAAYRVGKFARRHRGAVSAATALIGVLVAGLVASTSLYFRAERERDSAVRALDTAEGAINRAAVDRSRALYIAAIAAADADLRVDDAHLAREHLLTVPDAQRHYWEWQHLFLRTAPGASDASGVTRLPGSSLHTADLVLRQDGRAVAFAGKDTSLGIWRLDDLKKVILRPGTRQLDLQNSFHPIALTPDGRYLLTTGGGPDTAGTVTRWTIATAESVSVRVFDSRASACGDDNERTLDHQMALSDDGRYVAFRDGLCVVVRDFSAMTTVATLNLAIDTEEQIDIGAIRFRPDGALVVSSGHAQEQEFRKIVRIWDWRSKGVQRTIERLSDPGGLAISWNVVISPDGRKIALTGDGVSIWDGDLTHEIGRLPVQGTPKVAFSADGSRIASVTGDPVVRVWDTWMLQQVLALKDIEGHSFGVAFTPDGRLIAGRTSGGFTIWESQKAPCAECELHLTHESGLTAMELRRRADLQVLESTDCSAGDRDVTPLSARVFVLNPRRLCWTPWLVFGRAGTQLRALTEEFPRPDGRQAVRANFELKESGNVLVQLGFRDGTIGDPFEDGPNMYFELEKPAQKIRFKSLGKEPVTITFKVR